MSAQEEKTLSFEKNPENEVLNHKMCQKLVMDTTDPDISFDQGGVCNYWHEYQAFLKNMPILEEREKNLYNTVERIRSVGKNKTYDCILGLSGGVDSSYLAYLVKELGLRPLIVHFDNGWNNELVVANIENITRKLSLDLHTFVMDWPEFRDLQRAYFRASVLDLEVPTDHMIFGALYKVARQHNIKYIISGNNYRTEWLLPRKWFYRKFDLTNMKNIHRRYGEKKLRKLPALGVWQSAWYKMRHTMIDVRLLDLIEYNKNEAVDLLKNEFEWRDYGGKHFESIFTRFYQGYILPKKFNIDKRKAHLSNLILSGQMTRDEALAELMKPTYDLRLQEEDREYVARKLGFTNEEFHRVLSLPNKNHEEYGTDEYQLILLRNLMGVIRPITKLAKMAGWRQG